jgi:hypothetical protein
MRVLSDRTVKARKHHTCDASFAFNRAGLAKKDIDAEDWPVIERANTEGWKILPGQEYRNLTYVDGGELVTYKARLEMDAICQKYGLFDE